MVMNQAQSDVLLDVVGMPFSRSYSVLRARSAQPTALLAIGRIEHHQGSPRSRRPRLFLAVATGEERFDLRYLSKEHAMSLQVLVGPWPDRS